MSEKLYIPQNKNAQQCVKNVMKYLSNITYEKIITGQHTVDGNGRTALY